MSAIQMISIGKRLSNIYAELSLPICRKYGINQTCFDILLFFANNPEYNTARAMSAPCAASRAASRPSRSRR